MTGIISHAFSQSIVDATGTVTVFNASGRTTTMAATDLIGASNWNSAHNQVLALGGNTAGVSSVSGSNIVLAGGSNVTLSASQDANAATVSIVGASGGAGSVTFSAGTSSAALASLVVSGPAANIGVGLSGSTLTVFGGVFAQNSATLRLATNIYFSNSSNVSFIVSDAPNAWTLGASVATSLTNIRVSAGTTSNNLSAVTFSNSNGVSFGLNGSVITGSVAGGNAASLSYFDNYTQLTLTGTNSFSNSSSYIQPVVVPANASIGFIRFIGSAAPSTDSTFATSANATATASHVSTYVVGFYSKGTGASSLSLILEGSSTAGSSLGWSLSANSDGSQYSVTAFASYPVSNTTSTFSNSSAYSVASFRLSSNLFGASFNDYRFIDIPFGTTLSAGNRWIFFGVSSTLSTAGATSGQGVFLRHVGAENVATAIPPAGVASAASNVLKLGFGIFSSDVSAPPGTLAISAINTLATYRMPLFQAINF